MNPIAQLSATLQVAEPIHAGDLTIFPLTGPLGEGPDYLTLDEAMASNLIEITEMDESGVVGEIAATSLAETLILVVEGEQLIGAKQNRTLNISVLLAPGKAVRIPVSCTEAGRWRQVSRGFRPSPHYSHPEMRRQKSRSVSHSLRARRSYHSDQRAVWDEVDRVAACMSVNSDTADYEEVMEAAHRSPASAARHLEAADLPADAVGVVVAARGRIEMADVFDRPQTLRALWPKLCRGYALCGLEAYPGGDAPIPEPEDIRHFLRRAASAPAEAYPSPGVGDNVRIEAPGITGACLAVKGHLVHASVFDVPVE